MPISKYNRRDNVTVLTEAVCDIVFCIFTFVYLFCYQAPLLAMEQHMLSHGVTTYNFTVGAVIITVILYLLKKFLKDILLKVLSLSDPSRSKTSGIEMFANGLYAYPAMLLLPSTLLLAFLTDIDPHRTYGFDFGKWILLIPAMLVVASAAMILVANSDSEATAEKKQTGLRKIWKNCLIVLAMMLFVGASADTDKALHHHLKMECYIIRGDYQAALQVDRNGCCTDSVKTMLQAYALAREDKLGEKLFEYAPMGGSEALLPNGTSTKCLMLNEKQMYAFIARPLKENVSTKDYFRIMKKKKLAKRPMRDYELCASLLDKDIDAFAKLLLSYGLHDVSRLPKHYREAMVLYSHMRSAPLMNYKDDVMDADYQDFMNIIKQNPDMSQRKALAESSYGTTYWFYYYFVNRK